jgi:hypothetical protein
VKTGLTAKVATDIFSPPTTQHALRAEREEYAKQVWPPTLLTICAARGPDGNLVPCRNSFRSAHFFAFSFTNSICVCKA